MHELALTMEIIDLVLRRVPEGQIRRISLEVGALTCVSADALDFAFDLATQDTRLQGARLVVEDIAAVWRCRTCGREGPLEAGYARCRCGSVDVDPTRGTELRVREVEVV